MDINTLEKALLNKGMDKDQVDINKATWDWMINGEKPNAYAVERILSVATTYFTRDEGIRYFVMGLRAR